MGLIPVCLVSAHARRGRTAHLCPHYGHVEAQHAFRLQTSCKLKAHMNHRWAPPRRRARAPSLWRPSVIHMSLQFATSLQTEGALRFDVAIVQTQMSSPATARVRADETYRHLALKFPLVRGQT